MESKKIAICLPANMGVRPKTLQSLLRLVAGRQYIILIAKEGFNTAENRNLLVAQAVRADCTHAFFVDADMVYSFDVIDRLLEHDKDIIGGLYRVRHETEDNPLIIEYYTERNDLFPFKCKALGGGCLLIKTEVFKKITQPHFWYKINDNGMVTMSNDWWFCEKARETGYEIWCEPTINPIHLGQYEY